MNRFFRIAATLATVAAFAAAFTTAVEHTAPAPSTPSTAKPAVKAAPRIVSLGTVEPISDTVKVAGPSTTDGGRIAAILVADGDWVSQGQELATLDTKAKFEAQLAQSKADLTQREATLAKTIADLDSSAQTLSATLEQKKADRDRLAWDLEQQTRLQKAGIYKESALVEKQFLLKAAEFAVTQAELDLKRTTLTDAQGHRIDELEARAQLESAKAAVAVAQANLANASIRAPITGRVLKVIGRLGQTIDSSGFAELADTRVMRVRAEVFEDDAASITIGMPVEVTARSLKNALVGSVEWVGLKVNKQSIVGDDDASKQDSRVVELLVRLNAASSAVVAERTGLQVRVTYGAGGTS